MPTRRDETDELLLASVRLSEVARDPATGTPAYVYDVGAVEAGARDLEASFDGHPHLVAYAVKANSAGPLVRAVAAAGCGADVVSGAELELSLACGIDARKIVYSGVAKLDDELDLAVGCQGRGIGAVQIESIEEVDRVQARAKATGARARVSVRVNPGASAGSIGTHAHITTGHDEAKFGVAREDVGEALEAVARASHVDLVGFSVHVGSQLPSTQPYLSAARELFRIVRGVRDRYGRHLEFVDAGGGFGVDYTGDLALPSPGDFVRDARALLSDEGLADLALYVEPGRSLVAAHGVLVARVVQAKAARHEDRRWLMIDAGMNDLIRPALYQARHRIVPLAMAAGGASHARVRVVGPVCESSDDFGDYDLPWPPPEHVAILDAGAYGFTMASRYNGRPLPAEVFLRDGKVVGATPRASRGEWVQGRLHVGEARVARPG